MGFWISQPGGLSAGGGENLTEDVTHSNTPAIGNVSNGHVFLEGTTFTEYVKALHYGISYPTYQNPSLALSKNQTRYHERGTSLAVTLSHVFTQRDAGDVQSAQLKRNGSVINGAMPFTDNIIVPHGDYSYQSSVNYAAGAIKNDSEGTPYPTGAIEAGTVLSDIEIVTGVTPIFFGVAVDLAAIAAVKANIYGAASNNRTILSNEGAGSVQLNFSGADGTYMWVWIPDSVAAKSNWESVADSDNSGAIGGSGNLFKSPEIVSVTSTGLGQNYTEDGRFYVTNYPTTPFPLILS